MCVVASYNIMITGFQNLANLDQYQIGTCSAFVMFFAEPVPVSSSTSVTSGSGTTAALTQPVPLSPLGTSVSQSLLTSLDPSSLWSPSALCGLSTPPPVPTASNTDITPAPASSQQGMITTVIFTS